MCSFFIFVTKSSHLPNEKAKLFDTFPTYCTIKQKSDFSFIWRSLFALWYWSERGTSSASSALFDKINAQGTYEWKGHPAFLRDDFFVWRRSPCSPVRDSKNKKAMPEGNWPFHFDEDARGTRCRQVLSRVHWSRKGYENFRSLLHFGRVFSGNF